VFPASRTDARMTLPRLVCLTTLAALALTDGAGAQDRGSVHTKPPPPLANTDDP